MCPKPQLAPGGKDAGAIVFIADDSKTLKAGNGRLPRNVIYSMVDNVTEKG